MIRAENLIVEGRCLVQVDEIGKGITGTKDAIISFLRTKGYRPEDPRTAFFHDRFLIMDFIVDLPYQPASMGSRLRRTLGMISEEQLNTQLFHEALYRTRDDVPYAVIVSMLPVKIGEMKGLSIKFRSEPVIVYKMTNLKVRPQIDDFDYSRIIDSNKQIINEIAECIGAKILDQPRALGEYSKTPIIEKLQKFGFPKTAELLTQGRTKVEKGDTEDGLTDLREALVVFVSGAVRKTGNKPKNSISEDLSQLENLGYIDKTMKKAVHNLLYKWIYKYLSAKPVHGRERLSIDDSRFLFSVSEEIFSYLIEKVVLGR